MSGEHSQNDEVFAIYVMLEEALQRLDLCGMSIAAAHVQMALDTLREEGLDGCEEGPRSKDGSSSKPN